MSAKVKRVGVYETFGVEMSGREVVVTAGGGGGGGGGGAFEGIGDSL